MDLFYHVLSRVIYLEFYLRESIARYRIRMYPIQIDIYFDVHQNRTLIYERPLPN